jgi:hypothetical protein
MRQWIWLMLFCTVSVSYGGWTAVVGSLVRYEGSKIYVAVPEGADVASGVYRSEIEKAFIRYDSGITVIDNQNRDVLLREKGFLQTGACDVTCTAMFLGAQYILFVEYVGRGRVSCYLTCIATGSKEWMNEFTTDGLIYPDSY